ncbi:spermatogenesis-associated protein 48-like [Mya arenaria]|uniref:spermatogenesis-associated protein 48-like n=1 Tax=Mya arenaria TaxID=6604 RepID=UPI0022E47D5A|nr:spermatogenesis-associated protein 48-like [Mya arenaria]
MTEVFSAGTVLSDSNFKTRPHFSNYLYTDANAGGHAVNQIEEKRRIRHMKFPSLRGRCDVDSFQADLKNPGYKQWNDNGDFRAEAPYRDYDNIVDPVSGFVSAGGDVDRNTGHQKIKSLVQLNTTPQASVPKSRDSDRKSERAAPPELRRSETWEPGAPSKWNSRKTSDIWIRSQLGGWTSAHDTRKPPPEVQDMRRAKSMFVQKPPSEQSREGRDHLAMQYQYSTSTQKSFEEVPWDVMLPPKQWAPTSTLEQRPDMISQTYTLHRYDPAANEWQNAGRSWDRFQKRNAYYKSAPIVFCSQPPRKQHIPGYGGAVGAENLDELDNADIKFQPFSVKRVNIPRYSDTSHKPNIPGYQGCTLYRGQYAPAHSHPAPPNSQATTQLVHKEKPVDSATLASHKRESKMSKMVTLVPPCNPFNQINKLEEVIANKVD